ncbi:MAG TPA: tyrosine-type recombinase/integrase [Firmicutes bacterium]|nr:tyrosine-type recombinase/integrase [Bacillota bacterium]
MRGCYYDGDSDYVYVDKLGHLRKPHYITQHFSILFSILYLLKQNNMPHIKFHALSLSCALAMIKNGVHLKIVKESLGHSSYATTDKIYGHIEMSDKSMATGGNVQSIGLDDIFMHSIHCVLPFP